MKKRILGRTGLAISEMGFGCWAIGGSGYGPTNDEESLVALDTAWAKGVNFFDTADTYGHGHSETLVGRFIKDKPREKVVIATKAGWDFYHGGSRKNFDPDYLQFACGKSLERLGIETIDLYQLHNPILDVIRQGDCLKALCDLQKKKKIRFIGVSIHREEEALALIEDGRVDSLQLVFNLIEQKMLARVFPAAREKGVAIIVREPLACGMLSGKYTAEHEFHKEDHRRRWTLEKKKKDLEKIAMIRRILATERLSLTRAALEYVLQFEEVAAVIPGAKTKAQVLENLLACEDPMLRSQESYHLREMAQRETIFNE